MILSTEVCLYQECQTQYIHPCQLRMLPWHYYHSPWMEMKVRAHSALRRKLLIGIKGYEESNLQVTRECA